MKLRKILYADIEALDDYISAIDGYLYEEQEVTKSNSSSKGGKVNLGVKNVAVEGNMGKDVGETVSLNAKVTVASKLDKVIQYLKENDDLKYYQNITDEISDEIIRDDFLEVLVTPRFSKLEEITSAASNLKNLIMAFEPFMEEKMLDKDSLSTINGLEQLSYSKNKNLVSCVFNFEDGGYPLVGSIDKSYLNTTKEKLASQVYMLCKIQRKIEKGDSIFLDEILEDIKALAVNRDLKRQLKKKNVSNPEEIKDKISGPAYLVIPIAIYQ